MTSPVRWLTWLRWAPFSLGCCGLAVWGLWGGLRLDLFHALLAGLLAVAWWIGRRLYAPAALFALLLAPLGWHFAVDLPVADGLRANPPPWLAIEGTLRDRWLVRSPGGNTVRMLLGEVQVEARNSPWDRSGIVRNLAEAEVEMPGDSAWTLRSGRPLRVAGVPAGAHGSASPSEWLRMRFVLRDADYHFLNAPDDALGLETLRSRLKARAAYYLGRPAQAVYLPLVLDLRDRESPEGRDVIQSFRRVGISHLFAISGLNIAMIFGLLMVLQRYVTWVLSPGQGWVHGRTAARIAIVAFIWGYIALIGFPVPAVRAAVMGTLLIWTDILGTRTPGLYVLAFTGLVMLAVTPSAVYDISFQLSFLAYFFLVLAMGIGRTLSSHLRRMVPRRLDDAGRRLAQVPGIPWLIGAMRAAVANLWVTLVVTLGLWPLIADRFHNFSWLVFAGNLLLVPAMELALLPLAMAALSISLGLAATAPGNWVERVAFGALEAGLAVWVKVVHLLDRLGAGLVFRVDLGWAPQAFALYYTLLIGGLWAGMALGARRGRRESGGRDGVVMPGLDL